MEGAARADMLLEAFGAAGQVVAEGFIYLGFLQERRTVLERLWLGSAGTVEGLGFFESAEFLL